MRLQAAYPACGPIGILRNALARAAGSRDGNIALSFAILAAPLLLAVGIRKDVPDSTAKLDYIPYALKDCASSESMFISASDPVKIEQGLSKLFEQYLANLRLTQ